MIMIWYLIISSLAEDRAPGLGGEMLSEWFSLHRWVDVVCQSDGETHYCQCHRSQFMCGHPRRTHTVEGEANR